MISILIWIVFGFFVGLIARAIHPQGIPVGCFPTIAIGVVGSFVGGAINWALGFGSHPFHSSGFIMSLIGAVITCMAWRWYTLKTEPTGSRSFFTGKKL